MRGAPDDVRVRRTRNDNLVWSRQIDRTDRLVSCLPNARGSLAWLHKGGGLVAWGEAARIVVQGPHRFMQARDWWQATAARYVVEDEVAAYGSGPIAFGSFAFREDVPSVVVVPRVIISSREGQTWLTTIGNVPELEATQPVRPPAGLRYAQGQMTDTAFREAVARALVRIAYGEFDKVVLAHDLLALSDGDIDERFCLQSLATRNPNCWTYAVDGLVGSTPELLVSRRGNDLTSLVVAGTTTRGVDGPDDQNRVDALVKSAKNLKEHRITVESLIASLMPHVAGLAASRDPYALELSHVTHLATEVTATLGAHSDDSSVLDLVAALHPTAAVGGAPKEIALAALAELEDLDRGRYAGPVGWVDARGQGEWGIALRCAQLNGSTARLYAGCGIVTGSDPDAELAEAQAKFLPFRDALAGTCRN